jgi:hypothetical protein
MNIEEKEMNLGDKQRVFSKMIAELIIWAYDQGYEITMGDFFRDPAVHGEFGESLPRAYGRDKSCHKLKLAGDLNLFKDGVYLSETEDHKPLGEKWESMGGDWGGRFDDGNHYSLSHWGAR